MKKQLVVLSAAAMIAAAAVPALAFENEFHGMYRAYGYLTNTYAVTPSGTPAVLNSAGPVVKLNDTDHTSSYVEQRARLQYIAKANDDLKLVTHFELDALFGGGTAAKYQTNDAGGLDADQVTLETKNVYLDFNIAPVNVKLGIQPYNDAYQGVFGNFDGAGALVAAKLDSVTPSLGWFRVAESTDTSTTFYPGKKSNDLLIANVKAAITKEFTLGGSYYYFKKDSNLSAAAATVTPSARTVHTVGVDTAVKAGPAAITAFGAYQFGEYNSDRDISAFALGAIAKIKAGPGNVNVSGLYLSGDNEGHVGNEDYKGWQQLSPNGATSYFGASNMWLLIRNSATINTSSAIGGNDLTKGGRGLMGIFAGYDAAVGKMFYAANGGYAQIAEKHAGEKGDIGYELNATVGYKLYDNLSASLNGAYAILGDAYTEGSLTIPGSVKDAKDPYVTFVRVDYTF